MRNLPLNRFVIGLVLPLLLGSAGALSAAAELPPAVQEIHILVSSEGLEKLRAEPRETVQATIHIAGRTIRDATVSLKGQGSFAPVDAKPSMTLRFSEPVFGLTKLHLNNSSQDTTYLRDHIGTTLMQAANLPAQQISHATVRLNGRRLGLFVFKEGFTEEFARRHFNEDAGALLETRRGDIDTELEQKTGPHGASLAALLSAAREENLARRWERLNKSLDVREFIRMTAMEVIIGHWDGYALGVNNFRVHQSPRSGRATFIPTGMDQLFALPDTPWQPEFSGLVARSLMEIPEARAVYSAEFERLLIANFKSAEIVKMLDAKADTISKSIPSTERRSWRSDVAELRAQIQARERSLRRQLSLE